MRKDIIILSKKEIERLPVIHKVMDAEKQNQLFFPYEQHSRLRISTSF